MDDRDYWEWKEIQIESDLIGEEVTTGKGIYERIYNYISMPEGYGYDGYVFKLSANCVHGYVLKGTWEISLHRDMKIELFYNPELRETGKRYPRYKMNGAELVENILVDYEKKLLIRLEDERKKEEEEKRKRDKKKIGRIVCGMYQGNYYNNYFFDDPKYSPDLFYKAYFNAKGEKWYSDTFSNYKFKQVHNVKIKYVICEDVSKYDFIKHEDTINEYLSSIRLCDDIIVHLENRLEAEKQNADASELNRELAELLEESQRKKDNIDALLKLYVKNEIMC